MDNKEKLDQTRKELIELKVKAELLKREKNKTEYEKVLEKIKLTDEEFKKRVIADVKGRLK